MYTPESDSVDLLFPIIFQTREFGEIDLNDQLFDLIKLLQQDPTIENACARTDITTVGGYQPKTSLMHRFSQSPVFQAFLNEIFHPSVQQYMAKHAEIAGWPATGSSYSVLASWAVLYPPGAYQAPHMHREVSCVFTYYVRVPDAPHPQGGLTFINPHPESTFPALKSWRYDHHLYPKTGTSIVFPGWMQHYSHPHSVDGERLILTFDVKFEAPQRR